jgi:serine protease AprX
MIRWERVGKFHKILLGGGALALLFISGSVGANFVTPPLSPKSSPTWKAQLLANPDVPARAWIFFTDKGFSDEATFQAKKESFIRRLDPHALKRRLKVRSLENAASFLDLPLEPDYVKQLEAKGAKILAQTEWLNGVCIEAPGKAVADIEGLPFVREMRPEAVYHRRAEPLVQMKAKQNEEVVGAALDYGPSDFQLRQVNATGLQALGYSGAGVRLAIFDTGFDRWHESLKRVRVFKEYDFIYNDDNTSFDPEQDTVWNDPTSIDTRIQTQHGTAMLSILGGYYYGRIIGSAFGADFLLAKTEHNKTSTEPDTKIEEHNWVRAMRWADTLGADVVSSSLGYFSFPGDTGQQYTRDSMNGRTAVTSRIASLAADSFGILVVNAIGNVHNNESWLLAPSDAFNIVAVGGDSLDGSWWSKSCVGPTADGRTKPEVTALGWGSYMANNQLNPSTGRYDSLEYRTGTSGATAVVAGLATLLLEAHTDSLNPSHSWGPLQVREALIRTASMAADSNNHMGWGIPDGVKALHYVPQGYQDWTQMTFNQDGLFDPFPNPYKPANGKLRLPFHLTQGGDVWIYIYSLAGDLVRKLQVGTNLLPGRYESGSLVPQWDGKNDSGKPVASGTYLCMIKTGFGHGTKTVLVVR